MYQNRTPPHDKSITYFLGNKSPPVYKQHNNRETGKLVLKGERLWTKRKNCIPK